MATIISNNPERTFQIGAEWGAAACHGMVFGLSGDLGAGKTQLVKGIAKGLNIQQAISSPTFALLNIYEEGRLPLFHLDLYRLESMEQILGAGLEEYWSPDGISVIEWVERWTGPSPSLYREVSIDYVDESTRKISYEDFGS